MLLTSPLPGQEIHITAGNAILHGDLTMAAGNRSIILFAHGSGSSRHSPRNRYVAGVLQRSGQATLLIDLLTSAQEHADQATGHVRFDIELLAERLLGAIEWLSANAATADLRVGLFGASTGAAAAIIAAAREPVRVGAVVSRGGRPDLAEDFLSQVSAPTLLIVGARDDTVLHLNKLALQQLGAEAKELSIVPGATHLFEEPGALEQVSRLSAEWFGRHLASRS